VVFSPSNVNAREMDSREQPSFSRRLRRCSLEVYRRQSADRNGWAVNLGIYSLGEWQNTGRKMASSRHYFRGPRIPSSAQGRGSSPASRAVSLHCGPLVPILRFGYGNEPSEIDLLPLEHIVEEFYQIFPRAKAKSTDEFLSLVRDFIDDAKMIAD
jgi:hypothetical protein